MRNSLYLFIDFLVFLFPFVLSFDKRVKFFKNWKFVFLSVSIVSPIYIFWDYFATKYNNWSFNQNYILGIKILNLPIEELLFFFVVPFACLFIYECVDFYFKDKIFNKKLINIFTNIFSLVFLIFSIVSFPKYYTFTVLFFCSFFLFFFKKLFYSRNYWIFAGISFLAFFITNYFLTSLPIVLYSEKAILNFRITTIPIEDFFYNFSMLGFYLFFYKYFKEK